jgi:hypothetical protein
MLRFLAVGLFLFGAANQLPGQAFVQISTVRARPESLTCVGPGATTIVRLQIYLAGLPEAAKGLTGTVQLAPYSARPSINKLDIRDGSKEFPLSESPALVDFEVNCNGDTLPGEVALAAVVSAVPDGILIKEPTSEPIVHLKIERPK